jgi:hypothetical protein
MREMWVREGKIPRTGLPMTQEEKQQIEDNDGSIIDPGEQEDYDFL